MFIFNFTVEAFHGGGSKPLHCDTSEYYFAAYSYKQA